MEGFGLRPHSLTIRRRTWAVRPGDGTPADSDLTISPKPKVTTVSMREIEASGGRLRSGDLRVTKLTPQYSGGGYTPAQLRGEPHSALTEVIYVVTGPHGGEYALQEMTLSGNFGYELLLRRKNSTP